MSWPPRIIHNTDGHWIINYQDRRDPGDIVRLIPVLAEAGVDALSVLAGIDDDISWRGSDHAQLYGDHITEWQPDPVPRDIHGHPLKAEQAPHIHGRPIKEVGGRRPADAHEFLHLLLDQVIADGHELMQIYIDGARRSGLPIFAGFRMNDAHACDEARGWYGRSRQKQERRRLLIGSPVPFGCRHGADWSFSWVWNYAEEEVRERFLGLFDETLERYDFDGLELDFSRAPPFFRSGEKFANIPVMTRFMGQARQLVDRRRARAGRELRLIARVPAGLGESLEEGLDVGTWIREGLADAVVLGSPGYCVHEIDVGPAAALARESGVAVYTGFDTKTYTASPQEGYEESPASVLRAAALNGYRDGADGVHLFNFGYPSHRAAPAASGDFNDFDDYHLRMVAELRDPAVLERRNRCYYLPAAAGPDHRPQLPRKLALAGRGAGPEHALRIRVDDDVEAGLAEGRIARCELRLCLEDCEGAEGRLELTVNGTRLDPSPDRIVESSRGRRWRVFDGPPLRRGINTVLVILDGSRTPSPWPRLESCEILLLAPD